MRRLALVGGAALLPGLADELTRQLGVPAFLSDPLQRVDDPRRGKQQERPGTLLGCSARPPPSPSASRWEQPDVHHHDPTLDDRPAATTAQPAAPGRGADPLRR